MKKVTKKIKANGFVKWGLTHLKSFDISAPKATDAFNFKGEETYKKTSMGFLGFLAYSMVIVRFVFFLKRLFLYEENLRATGLFETNLDWVGKLNAGKYLHMDMAVYISSTNGTLLSYDKTYFSLELYQRSVDKVGYIKEKPIDLHPCSQEIDGHLPFGELNSYYTSAHLCVDTKAVYLQNEWHDRNSSTL